ncbi:MAG: hypothetical protein E6X17_01200 [Sporomusaceae bacterium]|nr:hypothetical protein [Sporomusaceae bacterium]
MTDAKSLWQDYWFLTREIEHYWQKNEHDLCFDLMEQRERLQARLDTTNDDFRLTPEGQKLLAQIRDSNGRILRFMQTSLRLMQQKQSVASAYDGYGGGGPVGNRLDQKS